MECRHYRVQGRVQGVFYRASTQQQAIQLGLTGWVRNCRNGDVEIVACGEGAQLAELEAWLWDGPRHARVAAVDIQPSTDTPDGHPSFDVRY